MHVNTRMCAHGHTGRRMHRHTHTLAHIHTSTRTHTHWHTHAHTHARTHTHVGPTAAAPLGSSPPTSSLDLTPHPPGTNPEFSIAVLPTGAQEVDKCEC